MEDFRNHFETVKRQIRNDDTLRDLAKFYFDPSKPRRLISGIGISSNAPNENGDAFVARGITFSLPVPLLWNHDWSRPLGRVLGIDTLENQMNVRAEIGNNMKWVDQIWNEIVARNAQRLSVEGVSMLNPVIDQTFAYWHLNEVSVVQFGADTGAFITRCSERLPTVSLTRPAETVHWGAAPAWR